MKNDLLLKPFSPEQIKTRLGPKGKQVQYIPAAYVIERLNAATDHSWDFEVVKYEVLSNEEVVVLGKLTLDHVVKMDVGTVTITRDAAGNVVSIGDDIKASVSDAIKRCARLFGVGLHLYMNNTPNNSPSPRAEDRLTARQLDAIQAGCRRRNWSHTYLATLLSERFGKETPHALTRSEASLVLDELSASGLNGHH